MQRQNSIASEASADSGVSGVSGVSAGSSAVSNDQKDKNDQEADKEAAADDEMDGMQANRSIEISLFGVLYTLVKEKMTQSWTVAITVLVIDSLQLVLLPISSDFNWDVGSNQWIWSSMNYISSSYYLGKAYGLFLAVFYILGACLILSLLLCVWCGWCFKRQHFPYVWPIKVLRFFVGFFFQTFYITALSFFMLALNCRFFATTPGVVPGQLQLFTEYQCLAMPHLPTFMAALVFACLFAPAAFMTQIADFELNPINIHPMACASSHVELWCVAMKTIMTIVVVVLNDYMNLQTFILFMGSAWMAYLQLRWSPFYYQATNIIRAGFYLATAWVSLMLLVLTVANNSNVNRICTMATVTGFIPVLLLGSFLAWLRLELPRRWVAKAVKEFNPQLTKLKHMYRFWDPFDAEIASRCVRSWVDDETLTEGALEKSLLILRAGQARFPTSPFLMIIMANFNISVAGALRTGQGQMEAARKLNPGITQRFAIFVREQENMQLAATTSSGETSTDLLSYVEFTRSYRTVLRHHRAAMLATRSCWRLLLRTRIPFSALLRSFADINASHSAAERSYHSIMERYPHSVKLLKSYARFLEGVKNDPWGASRIFAEAERMEEEAATVTEEPEDEDRHKQTEEDKDGGTAKSQMSARNNAVCIINAVGIIQMTNKVLQNFFGYRKDELEGKNVSMLMPNPFSQQHNSYLANYIRTGHSNLIDRVREVVGLHKERYVFPIHILVTQVSGQGEDAIYMGVIKPIENKKDVVKAWVMPNGTIMCVDRRFGDWFGLSAGDCVGKMLGDLARNRERVDRAIAIASAVMNGETVMPPELGTLGSAPYGSQLRNSQLPGSQITASSYAAGMSQDIARLANARKGSALRTSALLTASAETPTAAQPEPLALPSDVEVTLNHNYSNPVQLLLSIEIGGTEHQRIFIVHLKHAAYQDELLVTDSYGKIVFAGSHLVADLGFGPDAMGALQARNIIGMEVPRLLIQPFATLHKAYIKNYFTTLPVGNWGGCRSSRSKVNGRPTVVSVMLTATREHLPVRMALSQKEVTEGQVNHIMEICPISWADALDSRRLKLALDADGYIVTVLSELTQQDLFGFNPKVLVGLNISEFISPHDQETLFGTRPSTPDPEKLVEYMNELLARSKKVPGTLFRVVVRRPGGASKNIDLGSTRSKQTENADDVLVLDATSPSSGIIQVQVSKPTGPELGSKRGGWGMHDENRGSDPLFGSEMGDERYEPKSAAMCVEPWTSDHILKAANKASSGWDIQTQIHSRTVLVATLWGLEALTGVMSIAKTGKVSKPQESQLYPAGVFFGIPTSQLGHLSIHDLVVPSEISQPFLQSLSGPEPAKRTNRGAMASSMKAASKPMRSVGLQYVVEARHADGKPLMLVLQAVTKANSTVYFLRIRSATASQVAAAQMNGCGRRRLMMLLMGPPGQRLGDITVQHEGHEEAVMEIKRASPKQSSPGINNMSMNANSIRFKSQSGNLEKGMKDLTTAIESGNSGDDTDSEQPSPQQSEIHGHTFNDGASSVWSGRDGENDQSRRQSLALDSPPHSSDDEGQEATGKKEMGDEAAALKGLAALPDDSFDEAPEDPQADATQAGSSNGDGGHAGAGKMGDYKRGKRFKKLLKQLNSKTAHTMVDRFWRHSMILTAILLLIHIGFFVAVVYMLETQNSCIDALNNGGLAVDMMHIGAIRNRILSQLHSGYQQAEMYTIAQISYWSEMLLAASDAFIGYHQAVYLGNPSSPSPWSDSDFNLLSDFEDAMYTAKILIEATPEYYSDVNMSVWDMGTKASAYMADVATDNTQYAASTYGLNGTLEWAFVNDNVPWPLYQGYLVILDALVSQCSSQINSLNQMITIFLVVESVLIFGLGLSYLWFLLAQVSNLRFRIFSVFVSVPNAAIRPLANKQISVLDDAEAEDDAGDLMKDENEEVGEQSAYDAPSPAVGGGVAKVGADGGRARFAWSVAQVAPEDPQNLAKGGSKPVAPPTFMQRFSLLMNSMGLANRKPETSSKKELVRHPLSAIWMMLPYIIWAAAVVVIQAISHYELASVNQLVSTLNVVNANLFGCSRVVYLAHELAVASGSLEKSIYKSYLLEQQASIHDSWRTLLFGGSRFDGVQNRSSDSAVFASSEDQALIFDTTACMRVNESSCYNPGALYYEDTHHGLNQAMSIFLQEVYQMSKDNISHLTIANSHLQYIWNVGLNDIHDGLVTEQTYYTSTVNNQFTTVLILQIVLLIFVVVLAFIFIYFMVRRFRRHTTTESYRLAEMMSQLPDSIAVEQLVTNALGQAKPEPPPLSKLQKQMSRTSIDNHAMAEGPRPVRKSVDFSGPAPKKIVIAQDA